MSDIEKLATESIDKIEKVATESIDMLEKAAVGFATESSPRLERMGLNYFERRSAKRGVVHEEDEIHILNPSEQRELAKIQRGAVMRGALIGAGSGAASAIASYFIIGGAETSTLGQDLAVIGITIIATIIEIALLYADALRSVHDLAAVAGINLGGLRHAAEGSGQREIATALARTALELPTPPENTFGINPLARVSPWKLFFVTIAYKLKITVTNFIMKMLIRRMAGRVALREYLFFVDIPVTAFWDGVVAWVVIRNARICAMGPSAAAVLVKRIEEQNPSLSRRGKEMMLRAAATTVVRRESLHPNLMALMRELEALCGSVADLEGPPVDDDPYFLSQLKDLKPDELQVVLEVLAVGVVLDGKIGGGDKSLVKDVLAVTGRDMSLDGLKALNKHFKGGRDLSAERLALAIGTPS